MKTIYPLCRRSRLLIGVILIATSAVVFTSCVVPRRPVVYGTTRAVDNQIDRNIDRREDRRDRNQDYREDRRDDRRDRWD